MAYFQCLQGFDIKITIEFVQGLSDSVGRFRGIEISVIEELIALVMGLFVDGEQWFNNKVGYTTLNDEFVQGMNEQLHGTSKGGLRSSLAEPWKHITPCIKKHLTCEGRHQLKYNCHFLLLIHLRHCRYVNIPYFLLWSLERTCAKVQSSQTPVTSITHHGLVKLLVCDALAIVGRAWQYLFLEE